jgi:DNA-binding NarL/FixJ family response regulator
VPIIKIAIVEDDADVRNLMKEYLGNTAGLACIGAYENAEELIKIFRDISVDVVLMDISLPGISGIQCVSQLKPLRPVVQFLMCTSHEDAEKTYDSLCAGATGYILKNASPDKLVEAIHDIYNGGSPMSSQIARLVVNTFPEKGRNDQLLKKFTPREQEILHALAKGYQYKEIAAKLFIGTETVRTYLRNIYEKLQVHSKVEAINKVFPKNRG